MRFTGLNLFPADSKTDTSPSSEILAMNGTSNRRSARFMAGSAVTIALAIWGPVRSLRPKKKAAGYRDSSVWFGRVG